MTAVMAERCGFECAFVSGSALACSRLGRPDIGLLTSVELAQAVAQISDRTSLPLLVDGDDGFGHAFHVARTVRLLERAGAALIQLEDQTPDKGLSPILPRPLVTTQVMVGKIKAALDARHNSETLISARTDALVSQSMGAALERMDLYREAGADLLFVERVVSNDDLKMLRSWVTQQNVPVVFNRLQAQPAPAADELEQWGVSLLLRPDFLINAMTAAAAQALYRESPACSGDELPDSLKGAAGKWIDSDAFVQHGLQFSAQDI